MDKINDIKRYQVEKEEQLGCRKMRQLSVYLHIPFCVKKCYYCDFLSAPGEETVINAYMERMLLEIEQESHGYKEYKVCTVFIGGGTPSVIDQQWIEKIMIALKQFYVFAEESEITIEVNPGTVTYEKLQSYYQSGIHRLSIGLQSIREEELLRIGRIHTRQEFLDTYKMAREIGFSNINIDIMSALPGQTLETYEETVKKVLELKPEHISAYSLIIEEGTPFFEKYGSMTESTKTEDITKYKDLNQALPDEEVERIMYQRTKVLLEQKGYKRYETSNYALEGFESKHNTVYWTRGNYVGFGIGAASMINNCRWSNTKNIECYLKEKKDSIKENREELTTEQQMEEFMFLGLRLMRGVSKIEFFELFGCQLEEKYGVVLAKMKVQNLMEEKEDFLLLTSKGIDLSNYVMSEFIF